jgi:hypothetical protein
MKCFKNTQFRDQTAMNLFWTYPIPGSAGMFKSGYQTNMGEVPMEPTWSWFGAFYKALSWSFGDLKNYAQTLMREVPHSPNNFGGRCFVFWSGPREEDEPVGWGSPTVPQKWGTSRRHRPASVIRPNKYPGCHSNTLHKILAETVLH